MSKSPRSAVAGQSRERVVILKHQLLLDLDALRKKVAEANLEALRKKVAKAESRTATLKRSGHTRVTGHPTTDSLKEAERFREEAETKPPGQERDVLLRKARQAYTAAHIDQWVSSPGLKPAI